LFSALAYFVAGIGFGTVLAYYGLLIAVATELAGFSDGLWGLWSIPDAIDRNRRSGFQRLSPILLSSFAATIVGYSFILLTRTQNLFLRSDARTIDEQFLGRISDHIGDLLELPNIQANRGDLVAVAGDIFQRLTLTISEMAAELSDPGSFHDAQAWFGTIVILAVFSIVAGVTFVFQSVAERSRLMLQEWMADPRRRGPIEQHFGIDAGAIGSAISESNMTIWPLARMSPTGLFATMAAGVICFVFYRLALVWLAVQIVRLILAGIFVSKARTRQTS
jgi:hypothetical protein